MFLHNIYLLILFASWSTAQLVIPSRCELALTCGDCIQIPECSWCFDPDYKGNRCFGENKFLNHCPLEFLYNPETIQQTYLNRHTNKNEFRPQIMALNLRVGEPFKTEFFYKRQDKPVDVYYLIDAKSMGSNRDKIITLSDNLVTSLKNLTNDLRIGFGSFVNKVVSPFVDVHPEKLREPCQECSAPYGFHHQLALSSDTYVLMKSLTTFRKSGSISNLNGGMDGLMQALICFQQIGWREKSIKMIIFVSDTGVHLAGDGKQAGINLANDNYCHLNHGYYTETHLRDFPSTAQINEVVKKNNINVLFITTKSNLNHYQNMTRSIEGTSIGELSSDPSDVIELVASIIKSRNVFDEPRFQHNATRLIHTKITAVTETNGQEEITRVSVEFKAPKCPKKINRHSQIIQIYPIGGMENVTVSIDLLCNCPCEEPSSSYYEEHSPKCSHGGTLKCGQCECDVDYFGSNCECGVSAMLSQQPGCIQNTSSVECSGRGQCVCGECVCDAREQEDERIFGNYCECDNFSCERHHGQICGGTDHGICDCGVCRCQPEWNGPNCGCMKSNATCYNPTMGDGQVCSGHGTCECGVCHCETTFDGTYSGKFCERCPTCSDRCIDFKSCVQCQQYGTGEFKDLDDCTNCSALFTPSSVDEIIVNEENNEILCVYYDEDECRFEYVYYYDNDNKVQVRAQKERQCPKNNMQIEENHEGSESANNVSEVPIVSNQRLDEFDLFGLHIGSQLRQLPLRNSLTVQTKIEGLLAEQRISLLSQNSSN